MEEREILGGTGGGSGDGGGGGGGGGRGVGTKGGRGAQALPTFQLGGLAPLKMD